MSQCTFIACGNFWVCTTCGLTIKKNNEQLPVTNCTGSWRTYQLGNKSKVTKLRTREDLIKFRYKQAKLITPTYIELDNRLNICKRCPEYNNYACIKLGSPCKRAQRWVEKVLLGQCKNFDNISNNDNKKS